MPILSVASGVSAASENGYAQPPDFKCGKDNDGLKCKTGCCGQYGFCGISITEAHFNEGYQLKFGRCDFVSVSVTKNTEVESASSN